MSFLNSAFDSSTFIRTNYNYIQSFAAANAKNHPLYKKASFYNSYKSNSGANHPANNNNNRAAGSIGGNPISNPSTSQNLLSNSASQNIKAGNLLGKSSISTNHHSHYSNNSVSSKTDEGRALWLQHIAAASESAKRAYCSKTQIYCEAVSRALDISSCKVVPFFGAFLHDLRYIIESVPSVTVMCNRNVQKPIEVCFDLFIEPMIYQFCS